MSNKDRLRNAMNVTESTNRRSIAQTLTNTTVAYEKALTAGDVRSISIYDVVEAPTSMNIFTPLSDEKLHELKLSIKANGVLHNIVVYENDDLLTYTILSGHNRVRALKELHVEDPTKGFDVVTARIHAVGSLTEEEAMDLIIDTNVVQRVLTYSEQAIAAKWKIDNLLKIREQNGNRNVGNIKELAAEQLGWSRKKIDQLLNVYNLIAPLKKLVDEGKLSYTSGNKLGMFSQNVQMFIFEHAQSFITNERLKRVKFKMTAQEIVAALKNDTITLSIVDLPVDYVEEIKSILHKYIEEKQLKSKVK